MSGFSPRRVDVRAYQVYVPPGPVPDSGHPAILFLHGAGECGSDNERQLSVGLPKAVLANPERWPFLIVVPQKLDVWVMWEACTGTLDAVLGQVEEDFKVDKSRLYLTGLSQGGHGAFAVARRLRWRFAAVAPVCGWADPLQAAIDLADTPTWIFHGDADETVPVEASITIAKWMKRRGSEPKLTIYSGVGHNSWDPAYGDPELPAWFLAHSR